MDTGFRHAGFRITRACELNADAAATLSANSPGTEISVTTVARFVETLRPREADLVFGGPPCQGYSVAGKMDPDDPRSSEVRTFLRAVGKAMPRAFVMENVAALGTLRKWQPVINNLRETARQAGYSTHLAVLAANDYGVPQARNRMFLIGSREMSSQDLAAACETFLANPRNRRPGGVARDVFARLGPAGTARNPSTCPAVIRFAGNPILRRSAYAGMMFNGAGRPICLDVPFPTLAASTGGNKTHFLDENEMFRNLPSFVERYHAGLMAGHPPQSGDAPRFLRRLTLSESMAIQTFPADFEFRGSRSAQYRQIGNAVPCALAEVVARCIREAVLVPAISLAA